MSAPTADHWKKVSKLVDSFYNRPDAEPFREPVDWKAFGLFDYPKLIKNPMDLGTIKDKLKKNQYSSLSQVGADVRLVWTNCMTYNQDGSDFYKLADSLHRKWDDKFSKLLQEVGGGGGGTPAGGAAAASSGGTAAASAGDKVTLKEKRDFAKQLFALTKEDLGKVLVEVEARCPLAIVRNATEDEVELNVDHITAPVLQELSKFVETAAKAKGGKKKAGAGAGAASSKKARAE